MTTKKAEQGRPAVQPPDDELDFGDIPEVTDFSKGVRGKYFSRAAPREKLEAAYERLKAALVQLADPQQNPDEGSRVVARRALRPPEPRGT
jgi:hypothetical protein